MSGVPTEKSLAYVEDLLPAIRVPPGRNSMCISLQMQNTRVYYVNVRLVWIYFRLKLCQQLQLLLGLSIESAQRLSLCRGLTCRPIGTFKKTQHTARIA